MVAAARTKPASKFSPEMVSTKVAVKLTGKITSIGGAIDTLYEIRERKRLAQAEIDKIDAEYREIEEQLMERLEKEGTDKGAGKLASASVTTGIVANVTDWDAFEKFIIKNKFLHLLQRRVSDAAWREVMEKKGAVPGTESFVKKRLNLRVANST
jgi:hypothetical protein